MKSLRRFAALPAALLLTSTALASGVSHREASDDSEGGFVPDQGYRVHAGLGMGVGVLNSSTFTGVPAGAQMLGSIALGRRTRRWEWDTSMGWGFSNRGGTDREGRQIGIRIRSARADFSARFRLADGWAVGPIAALTFGTDTRYTTTLGSALPTPYFGGRTTIDAPSIGGFSMQIWGEAITQVAWPPQDAFTGMVGLRMGLPVSFDRSDSISLRQAAPNRDVRIVIDGTRVFFATESSRIAPAFDSELGDLSRVLREQPRSWSSLEIEGHSDQRGSPAYNQRLSQERAEAVRSIFAAAGIAADRMRIEALGPSRPIDPGAGTRSWARNRRVEIIIHDVVNPEALKRAVEPLTSERLQILPRRRQSQGRNA